LPLQVEDDDGEGSLLFHRENSMRQTRRDALTSLATVIVLIALMAAAKLHRHGLNAPQGPNMPVPEHDTEQKDEDTPAPRPLE
jgi:hypothetical protein